MREHVNKFNRIRLELGYIENFAIKTKQYLKLYVPKQFSKNCNIILFSVTMLFN